MGFVRRGGGGGGGGGDEGGDEEQGISIRRCATCRRELLPWEDTCPDDGGRAVAPQEVQPDHDALLARLLADEDSADDGADDGDGDEAADGATDATGGGDEPPANDEPRWPA